jgi:hypothetical protein
MDKICKNCKHFAENRCSSPKFKYGYYVEMDNKSDEILIEDDEGWGCVVGDRFGCIHFKNKSMNTKESIY